MTALQTRRRGGVRAIRPVRRCPYCGRALTRFCQAKKLYRWGPVRLELTLLVCRANGCQARAHREGWL